MANITILLLTQIYKMGLNSQISPPLLPQLFPNLTLYLSMIFFLLHECTFLQVSLLCVLFCLLLPSFPLSPIHAKKCSALSVFYTLALLDQVSYCFFLTFPPLFPRDLLPHPPMMVLVLQGA